MDRFPTLPNKIVATNATKTVALRLSPKQDLIISLLSLAKQYHWTAAAVSACVGSLESARIRFAGQDDHQMLHGPFEILSFSGTFNQNSHHLHLSLGNATGQVTGGHVIGDCPVYTTVELVLHVLEDINFDRIYDPATGYEELSPARMPAP